jgi:hypothetical protein
MNKTKKLINFATLEQQEAPTFHLRITDIDKHSSKIAEQLTHIQDTHKKDVLYLSEILNKINTTKIKSIQNEISLLIFREQDLHLQLIYPHLRIYDIICRINEKTIAICIPEKQQTSLLANIVARIKEQEPEAISPNANCQKIHTHSKDANLLLKLEHAIRKIHPLSS